MCIRDRHGIQLVSRDRRTRDHLASRHYFTVQMDGRGGIDRFHRGQWFAPFLCDPDPPSDGTPTVRLVYKSIQTTYKYFYQIQNSKTLIPKKFPWQILTPEVAPTKRHLKTLTNSVITLTMQQELPIESLKTILANLQSQISDLQNPQLMYRPPDGEKHVLITDYLDNVEMRLRKLEEKSNEF